MADKPSPPWKLSCPWCNYYIVVNARGRRGNDPGSGVEAALTMQEHIHARHPERTWKEFLNEIVVSAA